jgi:hypothetical protein
MEMTVATFPFHLEVRKAWPNSPHPFLCLTFLDALSQTKSGECAYLYPVKKRT